MLKMSSASLLRSSSRRVRGDFRGSVNIPNFGSWVIKKKGVWSFVEAQQILTLTNVEKFLIIVKEPFFFHISGLTLKYICT